MPKPHWIFDRWVWKMAWRDTHTHRKRLLLFVSAIVLGTAALVAIHSVGANLERAIDDQAKSLLGADLVLRSQLPFTTEQEALIDSLGGEQSREVSFSSMLYFPKNGGTRLIRVRALQGQFPFYGKTETTPTGAMSALWTGPDALLDEGLVLQYGAEIGDSVRIGKMTFRIAGTVHKIPGQSVANAMIAPAMYISRDYLAKTELIRPGSLAAYSVYFKFGNDVEVEKTLEVLKPTLTRLRLGSDTVASRKASLGRSMENMYQFLSLVGFVALLLGSIGVASAIHVYIKQKLTSVAVLRCIGAVSQQTFGIYLAQALSLGWIGSTVGAILGIGVQGILPKVLGDFIPVTIELTISWKAILLGIATGLGMASLFALLPLLAVRNVSPLLTLRSTYENSTSSRRDPLRWLIVLSITVGVTGFAVSQTTHWLQGIGFTVALAIAFGLIVVLAQTIRRLVKKYFPGSWSYVWRQALANLYRPNNQTLILMLSLGLGTFLITTLYFTQSTLLRQVALTGIGKQPNMVLFDIQPDQKEAVAQLVRSFDVPVYQQVPIVTMRIATIRGKRPEEITDNKIPAWVLRREYRSTYRDSLISSEKIIAGTWQPSVTDPSDTVRVSLEEGIAKSLGVSVGDELVFDVQGVPVQTVVGSLRQVNWQRVQTNFFVVFPAGVLESAPQFLALITRVDSNDISAKLQRALVRQFPNVSAIDLTLILSTVDSILDKVAYVIRFMALFSIFTGLTVLAGAVLTSRYQRMQESVLLRTLGASRKQIIKIMLLEYVFLGGLSALTGLLLALAGSWGLAHFVFSTSFVPPLLPTLVVLAAVTGLTIAFGMFNSRGIYDRPPLEILRTEV